MTEATDHTRIQQSIAAVVYEASTLQAALFLPFDGNTREEMPKKILFHFSGYLELVDWTGRAL